ncbi:MAG: DUF3427 domain-containing protein [Coriobacteriales bacterium]|nr:DUF3427 domain-containing protein [Coriobacteriales bacterium]
MLEPGLYEQTISKQLRDEIEQSGAEEDSETGTVDKEELSRVLAAYIEKLARIALDTAGPRKADEQVNIANAVVRSLTEAIAAYDESRARELSGQEVVSPAQQLLSIVRKQNSVGEATGRPEALVRPDTSVARTSLFTGSAHEPQLYTELKKEIASANKILMLVSFIKWSGLRLISDELRAFCDRGGQLQVITTSYIGATDPKAVTWLAKLPGAQVKISYDTARTRLHAKAYVFHRNTGFTTAYVGSSNLSNPAMSSGLEWNVKISRADQPDTLDKVEATFLTYWNSDEFEKYEPSDQRRLVEAIQHERGKGASDDSDASTYLFTIVPYPFQQRILDKLHAEREVGNHWKNLVVAATGTGKTVIAAFDYKYFSQAFAQKHGRLPHLLFVAHREEILRQSLSCFRGVLQDSNFGDLFVGDSRPTSLDHLFVSVQTFCSRNLSSHISADHYDYIVVDEIHHAAAASYQQIFQHFKPQVLLGLTATPERADGASILPYFDNRIAAEIRLPEAIDRKLLCPFSYFGVTDDEDADLSRLHWRNGSYLDSELENLYVFQTQVARRRAALVANSVRKYVTDVNQVHGLGFCVTKKHAEFMAREFTRLGIPSMALTADSSEEERKSVRQKLVTGEVKFVFAVDIFNEGVDIPEIDTVLFLRPTQSLTVFLQQLGRGLRLCEGKECLTVLDFIGKQNRKFDFASRFHAILEPGSGSTQHQVNNGFTGAPKGCYIHLERVAQSYVLNNVRTALESQTGLVDAIRTFSEDSGMELTLANFVAYHHLDVRNIYKRASFSRLRVDADVLDDFNDPDETALTKALARLCLADSRRWIRFVLDILTRPAVPTLEDLTSLQRRMLNMFVYTAWSKSDIEDSPYNPIKLLQRVRQNRTMTHEMVDLLRLRLDAIDFVDEPVDLGFDCPLDLHCQYTRDQILVAMDRMDPWNVREGVSYVKDKGVDVLLNTLNKSARTYSPSTMYEDYSINSELFHWQTQNKTTPDSSTGRRYITHWDAEQQRNTLVALFVREYNNDEFGTEPFTFLGLADCQSHEGSRPMSIIWKLRRPIPGKFLGKTNKLAS